MRTLKMITFLIILQIIMMIPILNVWLLFEESNREFKKENNDGKK